MSASIEASRGVDKYSEIANEIRRRIAEGQFSPGSQLPQRTELEKSFQVSKVTLQRAMNLLIEDGFIDATPRRGSFVAQRPPHLARYAMAFQGTPSNGGRWSRFWMALANEATRREHQNDLTIPIYYGIDGHTDTSDYQKLRVEVEEHRVAGVIFVADYPRLPDLSLAQHTGVPSVTIQSAANDGVPCVTIDEKSLIFQALDELQARGCRRIAFLCAPEYAERRGEFLEAQVAARGMETRPQWMQSVAINEPFSARNCMRLLMSLPLAERPDGLVITDDNLVESASIGLLASQISIPAELKIVAHANFPWKTSCVVEARRIGYDIRSILGACLSSIDAQRQNLAAEPIIEVPAQFEEELAP